VEPTDEDLRAFMKKHPDSYLVDPEIAFRHVYVNAAKRGKNAGTDALEILARLNAGADPDAVGDPFLLASDVPLSPLWDVSKQFGEPFGRKLLELKQNSWAGPVPSGFGLHLVFVRKRTGGRLADLKDVREMVKRDWMAERQKELKDAAYGKLRERYVVTVEKAKAGNKAASTVVVGGARQ
jgi:parvulin-like peptidyl-prolyl isomerase